jgi:opacity protein-like surface antigen
MRILISLLFASAVAVIPFAGASGQHAPRVADGLEIGAEVRLGDRFTTLAGIGIAPIGARADARAGFGIVDVDDGDSEIFLTGGLRSLINRRTSRFPLDVAIDAELNLFFNEDTAVQIIAGPSLGGPLGTGPLIAYVQPLIAFSNVGDDSDTDVGVRLGLDYGVTPTVDLRGDVVISDDTELRAAVYFRL